MDAYQTRLHFDSNGNASERGERFATGPANPKPFDFTRETDRDRDKRELKALARPRVCGKERERATTEWHASGSDRSSGSKPKEASELALRGFRGRNYHAQRAAYCPCHESGAGYTCLRCSRGECLECPSSGATRATNAPSYGHAKPESQKLPPSGLLY